MPERRSSQELNKSLEELSQGAQPKTHARTCRRDRREGRRHEEHLREVPGKRFHEERSEEECPREVPEKRSSRELGVAAKSMFKRELKRRVQQELPETRSS